MQRILLLLVNKFLNIPLFVLAIVDGEKLVVKPQALPQIKSRKTKNDASILSNIALARPKSYPFPKNNLLNILPFASAAFNRKTPGMSFSAKLPRV